MDYKIRKLNTEISVSGIVNLHFFEFSENYSTKNEKHSFCELVFVNSGELNIFSEDFTGTLKKHQLLIHRENTLHSLTCPVNNSPSVIIIGFVCDSDKISYFSKNPVTLNESSVQKLAEIVKEGRNVFMPPYNIPVYDMKPKTNQPFGAEQLLKNLLEYFLIELFRTNIYNEQEVFDEPVSLKINEIVNYVKNNYLEKITIDELAFLFGTNRTTLCQEFKKSTQRTVIEYINELKTENAKRKITTTSKSFTQISNELNFETIHYFTRFFKKQTGFTPKEYRKNFS